MYNIITSANFSDIEKLCNNKKDEITKRYSLDCWDNYGSLYFIILGENALQMFREKYGYKLDRYATALKTDGKTRAQILPYIRIEYYFDARDNKRGITGVNNYTEIDYLIKFDGLLLYYYSHTYNAKTFAFCMVNDNTIYRNYLPYNWEENNKQPQRVGVISDKKLLAWCNWLQARKNAAENERVKRENGVNEFLKTVRAIDPKTCVICTINDNSGRIVKNGLEYTYKITAGNIYEKITLHYTAGNNLAAFKKLTGIK